MPGKLAQVDIVTPTIARHMGIALEFGSGRGKLFVPEMDEQAFPPLQHESIPLRVTRRAVQSLIGLRLGR